MTHATNHLNNTPINEKHGNFYAPAPSPALPPPAYASSATVATASALYEYNPSDAGDLAVLPNDRIFITEFMNADWAKGRNDRTGLEGIFPRSYVAIVDEKSALASHQPPPPPNPSSYGNMPLDVSQNPSGSAPPKQSKLNENGKKFGKKMGNAGELMGLAIRRYIRGQPLTVHSNFRCRGYNWFKHRQRYLLNATFQRLRDCEGKHDEYEEASGRHIAGQEMDGFHRSRKEAQGFPALTRLANVVIILHAMTGICLSMDSLVISALSGF